MKNENSNPSGLSASGKPIRTISGWKLQKSDKTHMNGAKSLTVSNQTMSIKDLMVKSIHGELALNTKVRDGFYSDDATHEDEDMSKFEQKDLVEQAAIFSEMQSRKEHLGQKAEEEKVQRQAKAKAKKEQEFQAAVEAAAQAKLSQQPTPGATQ